MTRTSLVILSLLFGVWNALSAPSEIEVDTKGMEFSDIDQLEKHFTDQGFLVQGEFKNSKWPAKVMFEKNAMNSIAFVLKKHGPQSYPGYDGYRLKVVAVEDYAGDETVVVFRSKEQEAKK